MQSHGLTALVDLSVHRAGDKIGQIAYWFFVTTGLAKQISNDRHRHSAGIDFDQHCIGGLDESIQGHHGVMVGGDAVKGLQGRTIFNHVIAAKKNSVTQGQFLLPASGLGIQSVT